MEPEKASREPVAVGSDSNDGLGGESDPRSWVEDYQHENGNYYHVCIHCKKPFSGHKRRVICKTCVARSA